MGKQETYQRRQISAKKRRNHPRWTKETFPTDESSVGSKKKSIPPKMKSIIAFQGHSVSKSPNRRNKLLSNCVGYQQEHEDENENKSNRGGGYRRYRRHPSPMSANLIANPSLQPTPLKRLDEFGADYA